MQLTENQRRHLRGLAHPLKPIILIGKAGLTAGVRVETTRALQDHELIKLRIRVGNRAARDTIVTQLAAQTGSALVARIGHVAVLYRPRKKLPRVIIPDAPLPGAVNLE